MPGRGLHHPRQRHRRQHLAALALAVALAVALVPAVGARAGWSPAAAAGNGAAGAKTLPTGSPPTASVPLLSTTVTVTWSAATFSGGGNVPGYVVTRYPLVGAALPAANGCGGTVSGTSCVETGVAAGSWRYTVTPAAGAWRGGESTKSAAVTVPGV